jgi:LacI family transcriptional regulator
LKTIIIQGKTAFRILPDKKSNIITIKEIAEKAKVSPGTVDRVIHQRGQVSKENVEKVNKIVKQLGYTPNIYARNLALNKQFVFAVLLPAGEDTEYWGEPLKGIEKREEELSSLGVKVKKYLFHIYDPSSFKKQCKAILASSCDGVILVPALQDESMNFIQECKLRNLPFIFVDSNIPDSSPLCFIGQDSYSAGYMAGRLMGYGSKSKKYVIFNFSSSKSGHIHISERIRGFKSFFKEHDESAEIIEYSEINSDRFKDFLKNEMLHLGTYHGIFFPNSRAYRISDILDNIDKAEKPRVIGFDLTEKNIDFLQKGYIDFLINQNPQKQGYMALNALYKHLVLKQSVDQFQPMPLHIIVKENYTDYLD